MIFVKVTSIAAVAVGILSLGFASQSLNPRLMASLTWKTSRRMSAKWLCIFALAVNQFGWAFSISEHGAITKAALRAVLVTVAGSPSQFTDDAVDEIVKQNQRVDYNAVQNPGYFGCSSALCAPERHFVNDDFSSSIAHIQDLKQQVLNEIENATPDGTTARKHLGQALHTIQDFYAHSDWVETGHTMILPLSSPPADPAPNAAACSVDPNTLDALPALTSGYYLGSISSGDVYGCKTLPPPNRCFHGNYNHFGVGKPDSCVGINKDVSQIDIANDMGKAINIEYTPVYAANFSNAKVLASKATTSFVQSVFDQVDMDLAMTPGAADRAKAALLGIRGDIGFVIDTTGSMGDEIDLVKGAVQLIVNTISASPILHPDHWVLTPFNDPDSGPAMIYDGATGTPDLLNDVAALTANGGGDCPEMAWHGVQQAVAAMAPTSTLTFFSDASSKDGDLVTNVISMAQQKGIQLNFYTTGNCGSPDPTFAQAATATGGTQFSLARSEDGIVGNFVLPRLQGSLTRILGQQGSLATGSSGMVVTNISNSSRPMPQVQGQALTHSALPVVPQAAPISKTVSFPVDSTVTQLVISTTVDSVQSVKLIRPSGVAVTTSDSDVATTNFSTGAYFAVTTPTAGAWSVVISGSGNYNVLVDANSSLKVGDFNFVQANQDIHGGYFPIDGLPLANNNVTASATLLGTYQTAAFSLLDGGGNKLMDIPLVQNYPDADATDFIGQFTLPSVPLRLSVTGLDTNGNPYQRQFPTVYQPQSSTVSPVSLSGPGYGQLPTNATTTAVFSVTNYGAKATFSATASDTSLLVTSVSPATLTLDTNATQNVTVTLTVPGTAVAGTIDTLTIAATNTSVSTSYNSAHADLTIVSSVPPTITFAVPNHNFGDIPFTVAAASDSKGALTYSVVSGPATITGSTVTLIGAGTVVLQVSQAADGAYLAATQTATFAVARAPVTVGVAASGTSLTPGQSVTLTAKVSSSTNATPSGTVTFQDNGTFLGSTPVVNGTATYNTTFPAATSHVITAVYSGDMNFLAGAGTVGTAVTVAPLEFTFGTTGSAAQTVVPGRAISYAFTLAPLYGTYASTLSFSVTGLPPGATVVFSPGTVAANSGPQTITMTVQTTTATAGRDGFSPSSRSSGLLAFAMLLMPLPWLTFSRKSSLRKFKGKLACVICLAGLGGLGTLAGCGGHDGVLLQSSQTYTMAVTATSGSLQHSATVTLNVQ